MVPSGVECKDVLGEIFGRERLFKGPRGIRGVGASPSSKSSSSDESDTDVASLCSTVEVFDSVELSDAVEGSYSCFKGDEDRLGLD